MCTAKTLSDEASVNNFTLLGLRTSGRNKHKHSINKMAPNKRNIFTILFAILLLLASASAAPYLNSSSTSVEELHSRGASDYRAYLVNALLCKANPTNLNMCTLATIDIQIPIPSGYAYDGVAIYVFDHNCVVIGYNPQVDRKQLNGQAENDCFGMSSELPHYVIVCQSGLWFPDPIGAMGIWYNGEFVAPSEDTANLVAGYTGIGTAQDDVWWNYAWARVAFPC
ncbi:uncharacterized protein LY89DRAFT_673187 [Mollisia scopiformis]|uniref:Uncharacterized protein n=1 Tax=Mollisia scopiformis TaxID=149040 RepID=A0A194WZF8_MOLSC|nr:uncharacterized protein LY89DRAFT_673187 [Mollisia scopiformis]KUJ13089.1 hypothetical protein LY89DRAFT_673187 [Mollisia scopiformis]